MTRARTAFLDSACFAVLAPAFLLAAEEKGALVLDSPPGARFEFEGPLKERLERNVDNWLLPAPAANPGMVEMFRARDRQPEPRLVPWAGEFAGKYLISLVQALRMSPRRDLAESASRFVAELIATQAEDGYLGPFPRRERLLGHWDLWGHYHVLAGLLLWHERTGDERALGAATRAADLMCATYLDGSRRVFAAGSHEMNMAVSHVLGGLYRLTGNERYLRLVREIEKDWERAGDYFRQGLAGVDFHRTPLPRWESLHDLQGLVELFRITGDDRYRAAFLNLWRSIARRDRHSTGGFTSGEKAIGHPYSPEAIETCCTVAWMAISIDALRLTGDPVAADELELATWNGLLGAQHPSGRWWTYSTPMDGVKEASAHAIVFQARAGTPELNCCSVNGPRGLGMLSEWAVTLDGEGVAVNHLGPFRAQMRLAGGSAVAIAVEASYPFGDGRVEVAVSPEEEAEFTVAVRIPGWSRRTGLATSWGGAAPAPGPGTYARFRRRWREGDRLALDLDMSLRAWTGERECAGKVALYRGPILLAFDPRWNDFDEEALPAIDVAASIGKEAPLDEVRGPLPPLLLVRVPGVDGRQLRLADFASAGAAGTRYRSWLPAVNAPPPPVVLGRPRDGEVVPPGKLLFRWGFGRRPPAVEEYVLAVRREGAALPLVEEPVRECGRILDRSLDPGRYSWRVTARNAQGQSASETWSFTVDAALVSASGSGDGGFLIAAPLRGDAVPSAGSLSDQAGATPAAGPRGEPATAVALDGERGRLRYGLGVFPERDFTAALWVKPLVFPEGRIAQVLSAWAGPMDDPLRITIEGGRLFARIESGDTYSTEGVPIRAGEWIHVAAVKRGRRLALHVDGEERVAAQVPEVVFSEAASLALGGNPNFAGNEFLAAALSGFTLAARAFEAQELRELAARTR